MDDTNQSEVARIKQQIATEYQAASRVFTEFNAKARHAYLTACQEHLGACLEELTQHMSPEEAMQTFIQVQAEIIQKRIDEETTAETSSEKLQVAELDADMTTSCDETAEASSEKPQVAEPTSCDETAEASSGKPQVAEPDVETTPFYGGLDGSSSGTTS